MMRFFRFIIFYDDFFTMQAATIPKFLSNKDVAVQAVSDKMIDHLMMWHRFFFVGVVNVVGWVWLLK